MEDPKLERLRTPVDGVEVEEAIAKLSSQQFQYSGPQPDTLNGFAELLRRLSARVAELEAERDGLRVRTIDECAKVAITIANRYGEKHLVGREVYRAILALIKPSPTTLAALTSPPSGEE